MDIKDVQVGMRVRINLQFPTWTTKIGTVRKIEPNNHFPIEVQPEDSYHSIPALLDEVEPYKEA
jgi:hypothetical protein